MVTKAIFAFKSFSGGGGGGGGNGVTSISIDDENNLKYTTADGAVHNVGKLADGDMDKSVYDMDNSGIVDNAETVNGRTVNADVPADAVFTDTVYDDTELRSEVNNKVTASVTGELLSIEK